MIGLVFLTACESHDPQVDKIEQLIRSLQAKDWPKAQSYFSEQFPLNDFPLYKALQRGSAWRNLVKIQYIDHHVIIHVDLDSNQEPMSQKVSRSHKQRVESSEPSPTVTQFVFWLNQPKYLEYAKGDLSTLTQIKGWLNPQIIKRGQNSEILLPTRFSNTSYRILAQHKREAQIASEALGVIGKDNSGILESGWFGQFEIRHSQLSKRNKKNKKLIACRRNQRAWSKYLKVLSYNLNQSCTNELLFAAQRARYIELSLLQTRVDCSQQRGGKEIRDQQDEQKLKRFLKVASQKLDSKLSQSSSLTSKPNFSGVKQLSSETKLSNLKQKDNGVTFNGKLSLKQSLAFKAHDRMPPQITEAMIIAPPLTQCIKQTVAQWSKDFLVQETCQYSLAVYFTVEEMTE